MNRELSKTEPPNRTIRIMLSIWRIFQTVVFILAGLLFLFLIVPVSVQLLTSQGPFSGTLVGFFGIVSISLFSIILMAYSIKNDRLSNIIITLSMIAIFLILVFGYEIKEIRYTASALLAFTVLSFLAFQRLPLFAFAAAAFTIILGLMNYATALYNTSQTYGGARSASSSYTFFVESMMHFMMNPMLLLVFAPLLIACGYLPRMVTWSDWIWPTFRIRSRAEAKPKTAEQGFTLIEMLIVIAIISILFGSTFSVWTHNIVLHKQLIDRTQIQTMLQSEMTVIHAMDELPPPSDERHPLPIALGEFNAKRIDGYFIVSPTGVDQLVQIEVYLIQYPGLSSQTTYRLIAQKAAEAAR